MPKAPATRSSTPRLSEQARHVVLPSLVVSTGWPAVRDKCRELGLSFRPWQHGAGQVILAKRADGKYAATIGGTGLSIPRQVGKTFLVAAIVFALCLLRPGLTVIWTAHRLRTAEETFGKMQAFAKRRKIAPYVAKIVLGSGEEEIRFLNGSRILFGARERGFGRGFDEVDVLIFDEGQILTDAALDDMIPATNQSRQDSGALLLFMGTPPKPTDPGEVFRRMRSEALSGEDEDTGWIEFGADPGFEPTPLPAALTASDWEQVAKANPSYPQDTPREAILRMRKKLGPDSFLREGLGIWDEDGAAGLFGAGWDGLRRDGSSILDQLTLGLAVTYDRSRYAIAAAGVNADAKIHVELTHEPGSERAFDRRSVVSECKRLQDEHGAKFVLDGKGPAKPLVPYLEQAGVDFTLADINDLCDAFADMCDNVRAGDVVHLGDVELSNSVADTRTRSVGERVTIARRASQNTDTSPAEAVMLAAWPVEKRPPAVVPLIEYR